MRKKELLSMVKKFIFILIVVMGLTSCKSYLWKSSKEITLSNPKATKESKYLMARVREIAKTGYAFGHQDATAYGINWKNEPNVKRSDVKDVAGDFPGVFGFEIGHIELGHETSLDTVNFGLIKRLVKEAHEDGGIVTISWHPDNPTSYKSAWDTTTTVKNIIKGAPLHNKFKGWLSKVAGFMKSLKTDAGKPIPIIFRPYHEMNGNWFWWGDKSCTPDEFKALWIQTFVILTNDYNVDNLLYCYSPDNFNGKTEEYLKYYPGDDYVDILGVDLYQHNTTENYIEALQKNLSTLQQISTEKDMPFALTEGGHEKIPINDWWTQVLNKHIGYKNLAWAMVWRNARKSHHYAPYRGHASETDFKKFKELNNVYFLQDVKKIK